MLPYQPASMGKLFYCTSKVVVYPLFKSYFFPTSYITFFQSVFVGVSFATSHVGGGWMPPAAITCSVFLDAVVLNYRLIARRFSIFLARDPCLPSTLI